MGYLSELWGRPYGLLKDKMFRWWIVLGSTLFCSLFLWVFEPYGMYQISDSSEKILVIALYAFGSALTLSVFYVLQIFFLKKYTVGNTALWIVWSFLLVGTVSAAIHEILFNGGHFRWQAFVYFQWVIFSISIIPVAASLLIYHNITLQRRLKDFVTKDENGFVPGESQKTDLTPSAIVINSENRNESFELSVGELLYITSLDNYIDVYFKKSESMDHRLVRYSLSGVEADNKGLNDIFRCHKSYIVNRRKIESVKGNASGYKIKLVECDFLVPVSRKLNKELSEIISL